jgi:hypothetical protein
MKPGRKKLPVDEIHARLIGYAVCRNRVETDPGNICPITDADPFGEAIPLYRVSVEEPDI